MKTIALTLLVTAALGNQGVVAQSLGEVARREAERPKTEPPSRIVTDKDLKPAEPSSSAPAKATPGAAPATAREGAGATNTPVEPKYMTRDASYWLNRMRELRTRQDYLKLQAAALERRTNELQIDFDDSRTPRHRGVIQSERERLRTEHALALADLAAIHKQVADLEDEARRSNVPPGWLRP